MSPRMGSLPGATVAGPTPLECKSSDRRRPGGRARRATDREYVKIRPHAGRPSPIPGIQRGRFTTTRWSLVLAASGNRSADSERALAELCADYRYPLYAYVRSAWHRLGRRTRSRARSLYSSEHISTTRALHSHAGTSISEVRVRLVRGDCVRSNSYCGANLWSGCVGSSTRARAHWSAVPFEPVAALR